MRLILSLLLLISSACNGQTYFVGLIGNSLPDLSGKNVYLYGTSITAGYLASDNAHRYSTVLCGMLGSTEQNYGVGSSTLMKRSPIDPLGAVNMLDRLDDIPAYNAATDALFIFEFGMNDYGYTGVNYTPANFKTDYQTVINYCFAQGIPANRILILSPSYVLDASFAFYAGITGQAAPTRERMLEFQVAAQEVAEDNSLMFLDMYTPMENNNPDDLILTDGVHPDDDGHQFMAETGYSYIMSNYEE